MTKPSTSRRFASLTVDWAITVNLSISPLILSATAVSLRVKAQQPIFAILILALAVARAFRGRVA